MTGRFTLPHCTAIALVLACATSSSSTKTGATPGNVGQPMSMKVADLSGSVVDLGAMKGKVLLVDMWATWCGPCKESLPYFAQLGKDYAKKGLVVYAVSCDEKKESIEPFLKTLGISSLQVLWDHSGDQTMNALNVGSLPATLLVDRSGVIRYAHLSYTKEIAAEEKHQIESLLAE
jgi:thiol-disulfide isomerase/thioredoxin